jgi:orotate phosphoribosyltransferase
MKMKNALTSHAKQQVIHELFTIGAIKLGEFTLKSGAASPIYIDLRLIISYPNLLLLVSDLLWQLVADNQYDLICGIPYAALPIATCMSVKNNLPQILRRKELKSYGTKQQIEGAFKPMQTCLLVEDVLTTGGSILETAADLEAAGLTIKDVLVLVDREYTGRENLASHHYTLYTALTLTDILQALLNSKDITKPQHAQIQQMLAQKTS